MIRSSRLNWVLVVVCKGDWQECHYQRVVYVYSSHNLQLITIGSYSVDALEPVRFNQSMFASYILFMGTCGSLRRIFEISIPATIKVIILLSENSSGLRLRRLLAGSSATGRNELTKNLIPTISMLCWKRPIQGIKVGRTSLNITFSLFPTNNGNNVNNELLHLQGNNHQALTVTLSAARSYVNCR